MDNKKSNVINFPKDKAIQSPQSHEEIYEKLAEYKQHYSNEFSQLLMNKIIIEMERDGINFISKQEELFPSIVLALESINALHLRGSDMHHPLHDFADEAFDEEQNIFIQQDDNEEE